jgi:hypothetical protein
MANEKRNFRGAEYRRFTFHHPVATELHQAEIANRRITLLDNDARSEGSACQILKERGQFPFPLPQDWPALPIELSEGGISIGNDASPDRPKETDPQPDLWNTFQHLMLLSSENLLDDETHDFVHSISWTEASQWNAL